MNTSFSHNVQRLEQHLNEVETEKEAYERDIKAYIKENKILKEQITHLHASLNDADSKAMKTLKEIQELHLKKVELLEDDHKHVIKEKDGRIYELHDAVRNLKQDLEKCKLLHKENQSSKSKSDCQIAVLKDKVNQLQKESSDQEKELNLARTDQKRKISQQNVRISVLEDQLKTVRSEKTVINEELVETKLKLNLLKSKKESEVSRQEDNLKSLEKEIKTLHQNLNEKKNEVEQLSQQLKQSEISNRSLKKTSQNQLLAKDEEILQLNSKLCAKDGEMCSLSNKVASLEKKDEKVLSKHSAHIGRLQSEVNQLASEMCSKDEKIRKYKRELEFAQSEAKSKESQHQITVSTFEKKLANLRNANREKDEELCRASTKLADLECDSESKNFKEKIQLNSLEEKVRRLEKDIKLKSEELNSANSQLSTHQLEVDCLTSQKNNLLTTLQQKVSKLETENKKKEEELCRVSSKLAQSELEVESVSSEYRVRVHAFEDKLAKLRKDFGEKEDSLVSLETQLSDKNSEIQSMKSKVMRLEIEKKRRENDLDKLHNLEVESASKSEENQSEIRRIQCEKRRLESEVSKLKSSLDSASDKSITWEKEVRDVNAALATKQHLLSEANAKISKCKEDIAVKLANEQNLLSKVNSLSASSRQLKVDLEQANNLKQNLVVSIEDLTEKLKKSENEKNALLEKSSKASARKSDLERQKQQVSELNCTIDKLSKQLDDAKNENLSLQAKCKSLEFESSSHSSTVSQLEQYKTQLHDLQKLNAELMSEQKSSSLKNKELIRKLESNENEISTQSAKLEEMTQTIDLLKESCLMLERQVEDLESFNNNLIEKQNELGAEKDEALKKCSELRMELKTAKHEMKAELTSLDQCSNDQITELRVELRTEMNQLHEVSEQRRDLELKYKNLELHAAALQRKLNAEKDGRDRCLNDLDRLRTDKEILQQSLKRSEENLHAEIDRCDVLECERTQMLNRIETEKLEFSHELVRLNCQGQQQAKLIDFLQSRVEELEPADKKKKKKKTTLYQAPLQYRELRDLLEEEKSSNVKLQQQVNSLRSELQNTNSKVKRLKHGMDVPLSPGSIAAISSIVKSPAAASIEEALSPKGGKQRSKPRMQHNIPHRLSTWVCHRATRCSVCLATILFGHSAYRCSECAVVCHTKCRRSITNTCGLPGGLFQHFREAPKPSTMSPITCVFKGNNSDQLYGKLKVLCGDDTWTIRSVRISSGHLRIAPPSAKSPSKMSDKDDVINLKQGAYVHTDLSQSELPNTTKQDLSYAFKIQTGSSNSCWPARSIYFLAAGFSEKHLWVEKLEEIITEQTQSKNINENAKIFGNRILTMLDDEKLELNCSLPISDKVILFGSEEGLYQLSPSTTTVSCKADMKKINGFSGVFQLTTLNKSTVLAIEGHKHRLISFSASSVVSNNNPTIHCIENIEGCHLFAVGHAEGLPYLCVASATSIVMLKYNERLKKFCKKKEIATSEPCTCMVFTACSVIIGSNAFYEADLTEFKTDEFLDDDILNQYGDDNVFPIAILKVKEREGRQEFLLCFHEFGIFVDGFGRQTRSGRIVWSRMPLSFEYRSPYLIIVQFNSVEILLLDVENSSSAENSRLDRACLSLPRARYLGSAITDGAVYLSSCEGNRASVFCYRGNMKAVKEKMTASKRQYAALSASLDSLNSPSTKRSTNFIDMSSASSTRILSKSQQSMTSDTSRWTSASVDTDEASSVSALRSTSESENISSSNEDTTGSEVTFTQEYSRLCWRPAKTPPAKPPRVKMNRELDHISSTEV